MAKNTQKKIIEKAEKLLWQRGYEGTSLNDVVVSAGLSKGAFFHYYPSKQAISKDVIDKYAREQLIETLDNSMSGAASVKDGLFAWIGGFFEAFKSAEFKGGCLLGNLALEMSDTNDHARETIKGHLLELENKLASYLKPLAEEGRLAMEPRQCARLLIAALQGVMMTSKVHKDNNRASREFQALGQLIDLAVRG